MRNVLLLICYFGAGLMCAWSQSYSLPKASQAVMDSLEQVLENMSPEINPEDILAELRFEVRKLDSAQAIAAAFQTMDILKAKHNPVILLHAYHYLAIVHRDRLAYLSSIEILEKAYKIAIEQKYKYGEALILRAIGETYHAQFRNDDALARYLQAYDIFRKNNYDMQAASMLYQIALCHYRNGSNEQAIRDFNQVLVLGKDSLQHRLVIDSWNALALIYMRQGNYQEAIRYFEEALKVAQNKKDTVWIGLIKGNIGQIYERQGNYQEAERLYLLDLRLSYKYAEWGNIANEYKLLGNIKLKQNYLEEARQYYDSSLIVCKEQNIYPPLSDVFWGLAQISQRKNNYKEAFDYLIKHMEAKDSLARQKSTTQMAQAQVAYDFRQKQNEIVLLTKDNELKTARIERQNIITLVTIGALLMMITLAIVLYRNVQLKRWTNMKLQEKQQEIMSQNEELHQQREEIASQRDAIERQNKTLQIHNNHIQSSIHAAMTIQQALLPHQRKLHKLLKEYFVLYRPRDVVSGDFYWVNEIDHKVYIIVMDCTGHGVPGAFMSLIGNTLLDKIIMMAQIHEPSRILERMHQEVRAALNTDESVYYHGMDMALLVLERKPSGKTQISFAGAKRPLYYIIQNNIETCEVSGDRLSIGGNYKHEIHFTSHTLELDKGNMLYIGSDGIADQNDYKRRNFTSSRLKKTLSDIAHLTLDEQKKYLEKMLNQYMKDTVQRDDMLLLGIRLV